MTHETIYVLIHRELGWDNIVGVGTTKTLAIMDYTQDEEVLTSDNEIEAWLKEDKYLTMKTIRIRRD